MSKRNWDGQFAPFVVIVIGLAIVGTLAFELASNRERARYEQQRTADYARHAETDIQRACVGPDASAQAVCIHEIIEATNEHQRAERDLTAQQEMSRWGLWMAVVSAASAIITAVGIYFVWQTLEHASETSKRDLRAYLTVIPEGISQLIDSEEVMGHVTFKNVGRLPARGVGVNVQMRLADHRVRNISELPVPDDLGRIQRVIQPGDGMRHGSQDRIGVSLVRSSSIRPSLFVYAYVWGVVYYDDGYGIRRFTRFCHRYATASAVKPKGDGMLPWLLPTETVTVIAAEKARYHTVGNDAD